jgi:hypothetical protein
MRKAGVLFGVLMLATPLGAETVVRGVTLSTAGVAMIEAQGNLGADGLTLPVRRGDIDDFLKSLRLSDPAGGVPMLTMAGPGGLADTFATLPFGPEALSDLRRLIDAMTGAPVTVTRRGVAVAGVLMGTRDVTCTGEGEKACVALGLRAEDGNLRQIPLDEATDLAFADAQDRAALDRGLAALRAGARADRLEVRLSSTNAAPRALTLGWLQPAPVWKTAWRAEEGPDGLTLTGWAVVENTTGQDWSDVELTLATGAVQALQAQLYDRVPAARKLAPPMPMLAAAPMAREMAFEVAMDAAPVSMTQADSFSAFTLQSPVTLPAGGLLSLPFLQQTLPDARLTLYRGGMGAIHPTIALDFENPLPLRLPAGVLTLYSAGGHGGDAQVPELAPGARARLDFAQDTSVDVREEHSDQDRVISARVVDGVLVAEQRLEATTTYRLQGAAAEDRVVTILHPGNAQWQVDSADWVRDDLDMLRRDVPLGAGERAEVSITESYIVQNELALTTIDDGTLAFWIGRVPDAQVRATLAQAQELRSAQARARAQIAQLRTQEAALITDQQRLVGLIVQLGDGAMNTERRARVDAIDAEITSTRAAIASAEAEIARAQEALRGLVQ